MNVSHESDAPQTRAGLERELRVLDALAEDLNGTLDLPQALTRTLARSAEVLGLHTGWIWLLDAASAQFYSAAVYNLPPYLRAPVHMTGKPCWCIESFQAGKLRSKNIGVLECSRLRDAIAAGAAGATEGLRYHASVPLSFRDTPLGIMNVAGTARRALTRAELRLLSTIARHVGLAVERARLADERARLMRAEERARLAREIHDTLAQGLTAIALHLEGAMPYLDSDPKRARARLERALETTRESLEEARRSVLNLRSGLPEGRPLPEALGALGRALTAETGIRVSTRVEGQRAVPLRVEAELYRIAQEALANVRAHAAARQVDVTLRLQAGAAGLSIRDDGQGFDPRAVGEGHLGIVGMRERAALLGGRLRLRRRIGKGTIIVVSVPLEETT